MCGVFGIVIKPEYQYSKETVEKILRKVAILSESRGKDSSGIAFRNDIEQTVHVIKGDIPIRELLKSSVFENKLKKSVNAYEKGKGFTAFGHARLVTNGSQLNEVNNQPVLKDDIVLIHNGIIVNVDQLWEAHPKLSREYSIDTEIIASLLREEMNKTNNLAESCNAAFQQLVGTFSVAVLFSDLNQFLLATNNGSLYYITDDKNFIIFASEYYMLEELSHESSFSVFGSNTEIKQLKANSGLVINLDDLSLNSFQLAENAVNIPTLKTPAFKIEKHLIVNVKNSDEVVIDPSIYFNKQSESHLYKLLENNTEAIGKLKRCTKCLLPETFPFITYNSQGVCSYCSSYKKKNHNSSLDELLGFIEPFRSKNGKPDCLVPFSGGRDSTYSLHFIKEELGLHPIAFTYDWGMVTDLARRNAARVCGKLGVENIIVAADIRLKRENIRKNVSAWLKNPHLGMVPLFMAGDKYFFHFSNRVLKQTGLELSIWGSNPLENTDFKSGFTGIAPVFDKKRIDEIRLGSKFKLASFFAKQYLLNPAYINSSLLDTLGSFKSRYLTKRYGYLQLFDYIKWDEKELESLLLNEYKWEKSIDTKSTWRIGDGTAAFYNYIYHTVAGFSEFDTFRSNQIREGQLSREEGLALINEENIPRYENLRWYLAIIGLDFTKTIQRINSIPKLYNHR